MNKQPFFFFDTYGYAEHAAAAVAELSHGKLSLDWRAPAPPIDLQSGRGLAPTASGPASSASADDKADHLALANRSIYYGALIALSLALGSLFVSCVIQGLVAAFLLDLCFELFDLSLPRRLAGFAFTSILTPLPFFVNFIMPDVWAGLALLAGCCCFFLLPRARPWSYGLAVAAMGFGALAHISTLLEIILSTSLIVGGHGLARRLKPETPSRPRSAAVAVPRFQLRSGVGAALVAALIGVLGVAIFGQVVKRAYGHPPINLPFLTARFIADGPGARFIRAGCDQRRLEVCRPGTNLPTNSQDFLWSADPKIGVWNVAPFSVRRKISNQDVAFAISVLERYPFSVAYHVSADVLEQFFDIDMSRFNYSSGEARIFAQHLPHRVFANLIKTRSFHNGWPDRLMETSYVAAAALAFLISIAISLRESPDRREWLLTFYLMCLCAMLVNAAVCGAISGVFGRYQARVFWMTGLASFCVLSQTRAETARSVAVTLGRRAGVWRTRLGRAVRVRAAGLQKISVGRGRRR